MTTTAQQRPTMTSSYNHNMTYHPLATRGRNDGATMVARVALLRHRRKRRDTLTTAEIIEPLYSSNQQQIGDYPEVKYRLSMNPNHRRQHMMAMTSSKPITSATNAETVDPTYNSRHEPAAAATNLASSKNVPPSRRQCRNHPHSPRPFRWDSSLQTRSIAMTSSMSAGSRSRYGDVSKAVTSPSSANKLPHLNTTTQQQQRPKTVNWDGPGFESRYPRGQQRPSIVTSSNHHVLLLRHRQLMASAQRSRDIKSATATVSTWHQAPTMCGRQSTYCMTSPISRSRDKCEQWLNTWVEN